MGTSLGPIITYRTTDAPLFSSEPFDLFVGLQKVWASEQFLTEWRTKWEEGVSDDPSRSTSIICIEKQKQKTF